MYFSRKIFLITLASFCCLSSGVCIGVGKTYWIGPKLLARENGTRQYPFHSVEEALERLGPGNTFVFLPGIYREQIRILPQYAGTPQNPTTLKSEQKYLAILHGSLGHGIFIQKGTEWVIVDGFEVRCAAIDGIKSNADYNVIRNCWVHNNLSQGIAAHNVKGSVIERNLIEFNGRNIQNEHGIYADGEKLIIRQNIIRYNSGKGMALYNEISNSLIENNLIYKNIRAGIILSCPEGGGGNRVINNTVVDNGYSLSLINAHKEVIANNIFAFNNNWPYLEDDDDIFMKPMDDWKLTHVVNNIFFPKNFAGKSDNIVKKPLFEHRGRGIYFIRKESSAVNNGNKQYAAEDDFFGNPRIGEKVDIGCFQFSEKLTKSQSRDKWINDWPFINITEKQQTVIPDLWQFPEDH